MTDPQKCGSVFFGVLFECIFLREWYTGPAIYHHFKQPNPRCGGVEMEQIILV